MWETGPAQRKGEPMDLKTMRRTCDALVRDLDLPVPSEPHELITALCARMRQRLGKDVRHLLVPFPPDTVSGLWIATDDAHLVLCEQNTSPWHQLLIICHEFWHIEADHTPAQPPGDAAMQQVFPSLRPDVVARVVARRSHCGAAAEQEADYFACVLMTKVSRWLPPQTWTVPDSAAAVVQRLESALGRQQHDGARQ